ncbi:extracellular solute-binding protein [Cohnella cellulosilytica]|uniref:Extracellular solute-binding protein n=2 Tax=Cohnella cellulosilytica TaxID=986710 RepID=A0ABW2F9L7_9BACL
MTWNHTRGFVPMVATSQRFGELHEGVTIEWDKRSLQEFADMPIQSLVESYDLLVIDHPWAGYSAASGVLVDFNESLSPDYMKDQSEHTVGASHGSYSFEGKQTALAIDAATPVASWREDVLERHGERAPDTWSEVLALARKGRVAMPGIPIDSLMNFYSLCLAFGEEPFRGEDEVVGAETAHAALEALRELAALCDPEIFAWNPIRVYEAMTRRDDLAYCPFAYGYSNYARPGFARRVLAFGDTPAFGSRGERLRTTLGGTGIAVSAASPHREIAVAYAAYAAAPETQSTIFAESGGQPGHGSAWLSEGLNAASGDYFRRTLPALERAYLRPRYDGYLHFQDGAGYPVQAFLKGETTAREALADMNRLYRESLGKGTKRA